MAKFNIFLLIVCIGCAIGVVTSQHRARTLYTELQEEQDRSRQFDVEWGQLQLEQSTWATHARIEKIAVEKLRMQAPQHAPQAGPLQMVPGRSETR
ncbi:MAG: cell division protein FtsL [Burkholderiales bacterium]|nr:cell division protein FtsL [Pseudomonadota bacterium]